MTQKLFFPRRVVEPGAMTKEEEIVFTRFMVDNLERIFSPYVDMVLEKTGLRSGTILDVGCGPGLLSRMFAQRSRRFHVVGLDMSERMLRLARRRCSTYSRIRFVKGDASNMSFSDGDFDLVVCKDSFHEFRYPFRVLKGMVRVVKDNQWVSVQDLRRDLPWNILRLSVPPESIIQRLQYFSVRASYTKEEMKAFCARLPVRSYSVTSRVVTRRVREQYGSRFDLQKLCMSFQARYSLWLRK